MSDNKCINEGISNFNNTSSIYSGSFDQWKWNFDDGITSHLHPNHQYNFSGTYNVSLIGISNYGCSDTITNPVIIYNKPTADFAADITSQCIPFCSNFSDLSSDDVGLTTWEWSFENNSTSFNQSPNSCLNIDGDYDVSLIVTNQFSCKDTITKIDFMNA